MNVLVRPYDPRDSEEWDALVTRSSAGTFLHSRTFLSYHGDRFTDCSLVVHDDSGKITGVFPAALDPGNPKSVVSHPGITYGGLLHDGSLTGAACLSAFSTARDWYAGNGYRELRYKVVPHIYHRMPAQDDLYALFRLGAKLYRRDLSCAIDLAARATPTKRRQRSLKKALASGISVSESFNPIRDFWIVLEENLMSRHATKPVHNIPEIENLKQRFPEQIRLISAMHERKVMAGILMFCTGRVFHSQYIASSSAGRENGALDAVFEAAIALAADGGACFFDFGISTEDGGLVLNEGLYTFKTEFGGAGVAHDFYKLDL